MSLVYSGVRSVKVRDANRWFVGQDRYCLVVDQRCSRSVLKRPRLSQAFDFFRPASQSDGEYHDTLRPLYYNIPFLSYVIAHTHTFSSSNPLSCQASESQFTRRDARHTEDNEPGQSRSIPRRSEDPMLILRNGNRVAYRFEFARQPRLSRDQHSPRRVQAQKSRAGSRNRDARQTVGLRSVDGLA